MALEFDETKGATSFLVCMLWISFSHCSFFYLNRFNTFKTCPLLVDYYHALGLTPEATFEELKAQHIKMGMYFSDFIAYQRWIIETSSTILTSAYNLRFLLTCHLQLSSFTPICNTLYRIRQLVQNKGPKSFEIFLRRGSYYRKWSCVPNMMPLVFDLE